LIPLFPSSQPLFLLLNHGYGIFGTLGSANTTSLTVVHISLKVSISILLNASLGAIDIAQATFDTPIKMMYRFL
jgi:hypothetical protein